MFIAMYLMKASTEYNEEDRTIKKYIHAFFALEFVPPENVLENFQTIREEFFEVLQGVAEYFELKYVYRLKVQKKWSSFKFGSIKSYLAKIWW